MITPAAKEAMTLVLLSLFLLGWNTKTVKIGNFTYQKQRLLGEGVHGKTFLCKNLTTQKKVVIKVFNTDRKRSDDHTRKLRSFRFVQSLKNPETQSLFPRVYDVADYVPDIRAPAVVMEYIEGTNLNELHPKPAELKTLFEKGIKLIATANKNGIILGDAHIENFTWDAKSQRIIFHDLDTASPEWEKIPRYSVVEDSPPEYLNDSPTRISDFYVFARHALFPLVDRAERRAISDGRWHHQMFEDINLFIDAATEPNLKKRLKNLTAWTEKFGVLGSKKQFLTNFKTPKKLKFLMHLSKLLPGLCTALLSSVH